MSIKHKVAAKRAEILANAQVGDELKAQAVKAIYAGFGSEEWNAYMSNFASTPAELARLQTKNTDCDPYIESARAYLVANAVCLPGTATGLLFGVDDILDATLPQNPGAPSGGNE